MKYRLSQTSGPKIPVRHRRYCATLEKVKDKDYPILLKYLLDEFTEEDIDSKTRIKNQLEALVKKEWLYYHEQRKKKFGSLKNAFLDCIEPGGYSFTNYYRCVFSLYQNMPLSSKGSIVTVRGGRFNIGNLGGPFKAFPGFYIADNADTARSEAFQTDTLKKIKYPSENFALQAEKSHSIARVHGKLERVVDLSSDRNLKKIVKVLKKISPSEEVVALSTQLGISPHGSVSTVKQLSTQLFDRNWSYYPANFQLPHNSQDFGNLAKDAGIQALLYNSKYHNGRCLVIFPETLQACNTGFFELSDQYPAGVVSKIDKNNFSISYT